MAKVLGYAPDELDDRGAATTAREIVQQPTLWRDVAKSISTQHAEHAAFLTPLLQRDDLRIVLAGAGTSSYAGDVLAPALRQRLRRRVDSIATTDLVADPHGYLGEDVPTLLVSFSRSGDSPEGVAATRLADHLLSDCHHLVLTCNAEGRLYREHVTSSSSIVLRMPEAANDQGFAMTSSFTCMVLATLLVLTGDEPDEAVHRLATASEQALPYIAERTRALATTGYERIVYLGAGALSGLAHESALKLLELTAGQVVTHADTPLGFRHGPKAVLNDRTLAVVFVSNDPHTRRYDLDLLRELKRSMDPTSVIAVSAEEVPDQDLWRLSGLEGMDDVTLSLCFVLVAQTMALHTSLALGHEPDNPFPSKEVNRVVQGVTIYPLD